MKSLFDIQTESGQLWLDISAHFDSIRKEGADALAAAQATAKEVADKAATDAATAKALLRTMQGVNWTSAVEPRKPRSRKEPP